MRGLESYFFSNTSAHSPFPPKRSLALSLPHGAWFPSIFSSLGHETKECTLSRPRQDVTQQAKAITRRRLGANERHERQQKRAQRDIEALHQALDDVGVPDHFVTEIAGRLRTHKTFLGTIFGLMYPTRFGGVHAFELTRARGWDTPGPSRMLGALPKRAWRQRLRQLGHEVLGSLWRPRAAMRAATRSRWQWTGALDDAVFRT